MEQSTQTMDEYILIYDNLKGAKVSFQVVNIPMKKKNEQDYQQWTIIITTLKKNGKDQGWTNLNKYMV